MAITGPTDICNLAQKHLRQSPIADITNPKSKSEQTYAALYDQARRVVLEMHPWNFASKRTTLAGASAANKPSHKWGNASALLPADFIRISVIGQNDDWTPEMYDIEENRIVSNESAPYYIKYVTDFQDVARMSPLFIQTFSKILAGMAAFDITGNATLKAELYSEADQDLEAAMGSDGQQRPPVRRQVSRWNMARRGGYRRSNPYFMGDGSAN